MLALKLWRRKCALATAALLLVVPASAQDSPPPETGSDETKSDEAGGAEEVGAEGEEPEAEEPLLDTSIEADTLQQLGDIEEILITGDEVHSLQDAPTSSTSFSAADLKALRIENIADLSDYTPNLQINTAFAASNPTIFIRGIGLKDYNANAAGAVAVYQDGVNINSPAIQLGQLFDLEGIDVLRGPQGSVNGRNATAGAIMMRSAMPTGEFDVTTSLTYGNYDDKEVEAAVSIPLVEDMLSMRVSGTAQFRDGYTKNHCSGWDPTRYGFQAFTEESISAAYQSLDPSPGQWDTMTNQFRPAMLRDRFGNPVAGDFVYLDFAAAQSLQGQANVGALNLPGSRFLAEDLLNPDGSPQLLPNGQPALAGTRVATQFNVFEFGPDLVDKVCTLVQPGRIATEEGASLPFNDWEPGQFLERNIQPSLEDFANLKPYTNNVDNWSARTILLFQPMDNMEWMLNAHGQQNRGDSLHAQMVGANALEQGGFREFLEAGLFSEQNAAAITGYRINEGFRSVPGVEPDPSTPGEGGGNPYAGFYSSDGIERLDHWGVNGKGFWDLGGAVVTLLYDYEWYDRMVEDEGDANPIILFPAIWSDSAWQTTEELRIEGEDEDDRYEWTAGLFFLYEELKADNVFPNTLQYRLNQKFDQTLLSWAPYLAGELDIVEEGTVPGIYELVLNVGVRYNQEYKEFSLTSSAIGNESGLPAILLPAQTVDETWKEWTGDVKLSYTPFSNDYGTFLTYLSYGHGFKGGHFNASLTSKSGAFSQSIDPVDPEFIDAIELGIRTRWFDERLTFNAAVFRYWYERLQVFDLADGEGVIPAQQLLNGDAKVFGAEFDFRAEPLPGLSFSGTFGYTDGEFTDFKVTKTIRRARDPNPTPVEFDYTGNELVASPDFNWSLVTEYEIPLFGWGFLVPQYAFTYQSKSYLDPQMLDPVSQDGYWIHDAQIAFRTPDERIEVAFWVANLFDEEYKVDSFDIAREFNSIIEIWGEPRMYGVTLSLNW